MVLKHTVNIAAKWLTLCHAWLFNIPSPRNKVATLVPVLSSFNRQWSWLSNIQSSGSNCFKKSVCWDLEVCETVRLHDNCWKNHGFKTYDHRKVRFKKIEYNGSLLKMVIMALQYSSHIGGCLCVVITFIIQSIVNIKINLVANVAMLVYTCVLS